MGGATKIALGRLPIYYYSIVGVIVIGTFALIAAVFYSERISSLSNSYSIFKFCPPRSNAAPKSSIDSTRGDERSKLEEVFDAEVDDRFEFDPNECGVAQGRWVFNSSLKPLYSDTTCPYIDRQFSCVKNGRPDSDYRHWEWQPDDCFLPTFSPKIALEKLRGKRLTFVGDSLQRNQWVSLVCLVESIIPEDQKAMRRGRALSVFEVKEYNASIEFYWAPFLVESNSHDTIMTDLNKRVLKVDSVRKHAKYWEGVDILAFNSYVWWLSAPRVKLLWGSFANGEQGTEEFDMLVAYRIGLKAWANWVDSNVNPIKTRVFFTTMSPTQSRSADWNHEDGIKCYNETKPVMKKGHWGTGSNKAMMRVVADVVEKMRVPITFINITQLSEHRIDGHASIYDELGGKLLTEEQKADPLHYADCIHWCLPGVPDTWNQIFLAHL
ncbi:hypothetical protein RHMOL_Rhmol04G0197700 [Rhododendron molle]|uniref:Uncharacterized protein n=1 Tax=Rhododendron molle TaxID=49168 RepID=A0ACC0P4I3_RHOML|nr:hypothetical protein RHMOL_Rhmol04G0197700 [Rhododendron molle]